MIIRAMHISALMPLINKLREIRRDPYTTSDECVPVSAKDEINDVLELINIYTTDSSILFDVFTIEQLIELFDLIDALLGGNLPGITNTVTLNLKYSILLIKKVPKNVRIINKEIGKLCNPP